MRSTALAGFFILAACAPGAGGATSAAPHLLPYWTITPSLTPATPEGLVVSAETPLPSPTPFVYTVASGDTLSQIAEKFNVSLDALLAANPDVNPNALPVGRALDIPSNPENPAGEATPTPVPLAVEQIACHPTIDRGAWCFVLIHNNSPDIIEDVIAQVTLIDSRGRGIASQSALLPLNILRPNLSLPLSVFFSPDVPSDAKPQVQILTAIRLLPDDVHYLPAAIGHTLVRVDGSGLSAQVTGTVILPADSRPAGEVWVAAVGYDAAGNVNGVRRWESHTGLAAGGSLPFSLVLSSIAGRIERVDFCVEARPQ